MEFTPEMRKKTCLIYDILTGSDVGEAREILREAQRMANRRSIIPAFKPAWREQTLFEILPEHEAEGNE